jgi:hypothetical protein
MTIIDSLNPELECPFSGCLDNWRQIEIYLSDQNGYRKQISVDTLLRQFEGDE